MTPRADVNELTFGDHQGRLSIRAQGLDSRCFSNRPSTCPHCAGAKTETMPTDACQFFYECTGCWGTKLKPSRAIVVCSDSYGSARVSADSSRARGRTGRVLLWVTDDDQRADTKSRATGWQSAHQFAGVVAPTAAICCRFVCSCICSDRDLDHRPRLDGHGVAF